MEETEVRLGKHEEQEMDGYRSLDPVAVIGLILGLVSVGAVLFSPLFLFFAFFSFVAGLASLIRIRASAGSVGGSWVAVLGIGFALLFTCMQVTYAHQRDQHIQSLAKEFAMEWLNKIRTGKLNEAHQQTMGFFERVVPGTDLDEHYSPEKKAFDPSGAPPGPGTGSEVMMNLGGTPHETKLDFYRRPVIREIKEYGEACEIEFVENITSYRNGLFMDYVVHKFRLTYPVDGTEKSEFFTVTMKREAYKQPFGVQWAVDMVDDQLTMIDRTRGMSDP